MATVDFDGIRKEICLAYLPDVEVGDYAIVHVGFAISKVDEASALETLQMFRSSASSTRSWRRPSEGPRRRLT